LEGRFGSPRGLQELLCAAGGWIDRPHKKEEIKGLIVKQFLSIGEGWLNGFGAETG
jgi:hypothetical protein